MSLETFSDDLQIVCIHEIHFFCSNVLPTLNVARPPAYARSMHPTLHKLAAPLPMQPLQRKAIEDNKAKFSNWKANSTISWYFLKVKRSLEFIKRPELPSCESITHSSACVYPPLIAVPAFLHGVKNRPVANRSLSRRIEFLGFHFHPNYRIGLYELIANWTKSSDERSKGHLHLSPAPRRHDNESNSLSPHRLPLPFSMNSCTCFG